MKRVCPKHKIELKVTRSYYPVKKEALTCMECVREMVKADNECSKSIVLKTVV